MRPALLCITQTLCDTKAVKPRNDGESHAEFLRSLSERESEFARLEAQQERLLGEITDFRTSLPGDRLGRDEVHSRAVR